MSEIVKLDNQIIVKPNKDIIASTAPELKEELRALVEESPGKIVMDLTDVQMIDSLGLGVLIATHNSLSKLGGKVALTRISPDIRNLLKTMRLDRHFQLEE